MTAVTPRRHLDLIDVKEPCPARWDAMQGDGPVRFCGQCKMNVYNLSAMTAEDAERTVREREGRLCVRFYRRRDGTVTTTDCAPVRFAALRRRARRTVGAAAALVVALLGVIAGLGLFRLLGFDLGREVERTKLGQAVQKIVEPVMWPEPEVEVYQGEEMGEALPWPDETGGR